MKPKKDGGPSKGRIDDARFANFETDPRYRLPSKKHTKTTIDKRFSGMLVEEDFISNAKVDRYGRKIKSDSKKKALERLYRVESDDEDDGPKTAEPASNDVDDDELVQRELRAAYDMETRRKRDPAREGGFSCSESDSSSDEDSDDDEGGVGLASHEEMQRFQDQQAEVESGEVTNRIAIVNLDWDHVKSTDLMALFSSFVPGKVGQITSISIYPSEFGKERMRQEETEGPPKALFKNEARGDADTDDESGSESGDERIKKELIKEGDDQDFDSDALRAYQLDRLRYYYAVMVCSNPETAKAIYEATDGTEYQASSNFIDLRFIPDQVTFEGEPRDQCTKVPDSYRPVEFVTNALQSSKVKLTWDMHPEEASRKESIKRAFGGSRNELEENDLRAYLASDSSGDDAESDEGDGSGDTKLTKREAARKKMREALGLADEAATKRFKDGPVGEMEITFAPALAHDKAEEAGEEETTIDKYKRKERERKERKRQETTKAEEQSEQKEDEDLGFNDPFFTTDEPAATSKSALRKEERRKRREAREEAEAETEALKAKLSGVMTEDADGLEHFDMKDIVRADKDEEKGRKKKKKKKKKSRESAQKEGLMQEGFEMDLGDDRFQAVFDSHEFAIDPSNPKFKATSGMKQLLKEVREKKRHRGGEDGEGGKKKRTKVEEERGKKKRTQG
ncbi:pre-rRNA-processing protein ESF1 [Ophiocordyceps camponoti-floridani]|uniref:Pre-rRNA-processing protein ESF1 n=1 Tax=Ophiocordyceps camponoti-floridani TaxID=2030778 RepID=A0A8H4VBX7_9HYPO|nr:pre-rRNA-processing protein ESF1 [Ophiocordyceps camponoti-floridani]